MSEKPPKRPYFFLSLTFHLGLIMLGAIVTLLHPKTRELFIPSIQIDVVGLPTEVKQEDVKQPDLSLPVKENVAPPAPNPKTDSVDDMKALPDKKLVEKDALSALEKIRKSQEKERKANLKKQAQEILDKKRADLKEFEEKYRKAISGNEKSSGNSTTGNVSAEVRNAYQAHFMERLRSNWNLPLWLKSQPLTARVQFFIDGSGVIYSYKFLTSSGNEIFDEYVKTAIGRSSPLAPPPAEMVNDLRSGKFVVRFPL